MNLNEIKVVNKNVPYDRVANFIEFVVGASYDKDGKYHEYLKDYAMAGAIISLYTDYDSTEYTFSNIMDFIITPEYAKIKEDLGIEYDRFAAYVNNEIEYMNTPLRFADDMLKAINKSMQKVNVVLDAINVDKLKEYDFTALMNAIDAVSSIDKKEDVVAESNNSDNVVKLFDSENK